MKKHIASCDVRSHSNATEKHRSICRQNIEVDIRTDKKAAKYAP